MEPRITINFEVKLCTRRLLTTAYFGGMSEFTVPPQGYDFEDDKTQITTKNVSQKDLPTSILKTN
ncbi:hypothetical protein GCM10007916_27790 [Psychromonas marina]|uniref:Uncharacterized protein n=1 Tax=Psychromonas marina TaxID=88364 RepID=A0ABQ6E2S6_9GAMM|nr:hypothetical protein GCM10007916_27790 [Psychromonas marina]